LISFRTNFKYIILYCIVFYIETIGLFSYINKNTKYLYGCILIILTILLLINNFKNRVRYSVSLNILIFMIVVYYSYVLINGICFHNMDRLVLGFNQYILFSLPLFIVLYLFKKSMDTIRLDKFIKYIILLSFITSILCMYEYFSGKYIMPNNSIIAYVDYNNTFVRAQVFTGSYLGLGACLSQLSLLNLYYIFNKNSKRKLKITHIFIFIVNVIGILCTSSRGPLVATVIATIFFIFLYNISAISADVRKIYMLIALMILIFILMYIGINFILNYHAQPDNIYLNTFMGRIQSVFNWNTDGSNIQRKYFWQYFMNIFKNNFMYGIGVSSTGANISTTSIGPTESGVLKRFVELGIFGGFIYYFIIILIFLIIIRYLLIKNNNYNEKLLIVTLTSSIIATNIDDITYQVCEEIQVMFFFWLFIGIILFIINKSKSSNKFE
jgi:hypothetical protein